MRRRAVTTAVIAAAVAAVAFGAAAATVVAQQATPALAADPLALDSAFRRAGPVLRWNAIARDLVGRDLAVRQQRPPRATFYDGNNNTRLYALVSGAQYEALRAVADSGTADAAASAAAASVLGTVFPRERAWLAREVAATRARQQAGGRSETRLRAAEKVGTRAARRWTAYAAAELRVATWADSVPTGPDRWRGDEGPPSLAISLGLRPWFLTGRDQFRPPPPPPPGSAAFTEALGEVRAATEQRTRAQTKASWAWSRNAATLWSEIAGDVVLRQRLGELETARAFMYLNMALSDATIACWDAKLTYWLPRPSAVDPTLDLAIGLPNFPAYPSAHATLFAAGAAVLGHLVPAEQAALDSVAREATASRVWAGVHYPFDNTAGTRLGRQVAEAAIATLEAQSPPDRRAMRR
ncbi:MAG: vanadium-dependent haloperoxidase [Gemmatimonadales bacterium]